MENGLQRHANVPVKNIYLATLNGLKCLISFQKRSVWFAWHTCHETVLRNNIEKYLWSGNIWSMNTLCLFALWYNTSIQAPLFIYAFSGCDLRSVGLNLTTGPIWLCVNSEDMEWVEGARKCTKDGGSLVIINNEEKLNAVSGSILNIRHHSSPML